MSDEPAREPKTSHTIRLTASMLAGALVGVIFCPAAGSGWDSWFRAAPLTYTVTGALCGLAVELFRRFLDFPANSRAKPEKP